MRRGVVVLVLASSLAAGCASTPSEPVAVSGLLDPLPTEQPEVLAGDPYAKTAGTEERVRPEAGAPAQFLAPDARVVDSVTAPDEPLSLAVVFVREGQLVRDPQGLLALERQLAADEDLSAVLSLSPPESCAIGIGGLAARARRERRDWVLIEAREGVRRRGFLVRARDGALLARYPQATQPRSLRASVAAGPPDLLVRLHHAFRRFRASEEPHRP